MKRYTAECDQIDQIDQISPGESESSYGHSPAEAWLRVGEQRINGTGPCLESPAGPAVAVASPSLGFECWPRWSWPWPSPVASSCADGCSWC